MVKVETDEGIHGLGEGGISGRELAMQGMLEHFSQALIGQDPRRIEHIWQQLYRGAYFEGGKITAAVVSAIDIALWDILGKWLNVPVWQLLGGAVRDTIPCFATPGSLNGPEIVETARQAVADGWKVLRFTPGLTEPGWSGGDGATYDPLASIDAAVQYLGEIRTALGPDALLSIDFHHRLSPVEAALFCQRVEHLNLYFIEEPIRCENPDAYAQLRTMTRIAVRDWRRVLQQVGICAVPRARPAQFRADRCLQRGRAVRVAQDRRLVRDALCRPDAAQPARTDFDGGLRAPGGGDLELRLPGILPDARSRPAAGYFPGHAGDGERKLSAADRTGPGRGVQRGCRR